MNKSLIKRVQMLEKPLSATEKRIMDILISQPDAALFESVNSIAVMANTHGSSLVRLARKLGFSGFPEMRQYLRNDVSSPHRTEDLIRARLNQSETSDILTELVESEIEALKSLQQFVTQEPSLKALH